MNSQLEPMEKGMGLSTPYIIQRECREPMRCILSFNSHKIIRSRVELKNSTHFGTCRSISQCTKEFLLLQIWMCFQLAQIGWYLTLDLNIVYWYFKQTKSSIKNLGPEQN